MTRTHGDGKIIGHREMRVSATTIRMAALLLGLAVGAEVRAEATATARVGAWHGTIGKSQVHVCFTKFGEGHYYYLRHRAGIRLEVPDAGDAADRFERLTNALTLGELDLVEASGTFGSDSAPTGLWTLHADGDGWTGDWRKPDGSRTLPIRLTRLPSTGRSPKVDGSDCPGEYYAPLRDDLRVTEDEAEFEGHRYSTLTTPSATAMAINAEAKVSNGINAHAKNWLEEQAVFAHDCALGTGSGKIALARTLEPIVWSQDFIVQLDNLPDTYCGGAHTFSQQNYIVWDLAGGERIDTWSWIDGGAALLKLTDTDDGEQVATSFRQLLHDRHPRNTADDQCAEVMNVMGINAPYPTARGLTFPTDFFHAMRACGNDVLLTWAQVAPYLSEAGQAAMKRSTN